MTIELRLAELAIALPEPPTPVGLYVGAVVTGNLAFVAGHGPRRSDGGHLTGKVPTEVGVEAAIRAARLCGLNVLSSLRAAIGDLDRVDRFVKVLGFVNATPEFKDHPRVIDGFSTLMIDIFGESACCARSSVGMSSLPFQVPVEIDAVVALKS